MAETAPEPNGAAAILRHLGAGPATVRVNGARVILAAPSGGSELVLNPRILNRLAQSRLIARDAALVSLTDAGRSYAARRGLLDQDFTDRRQAHAQSETIRMDGREHTVRRSGEESPIDALRQRRDRSGRAFLTDEQHAAGERLRRDFTIANVQPSIGMRWDFHGGKGNGHRGDHGLTVTEAALSARRRFHDAMDAMGPELAGPVVDVCCFLKGLEQVESERAWPVRSAKVMVRAGLSALARHYAGPSRPWRSSHNPPLSSSAVAGAPPRT